MARKPKKGYFVNGHFVTLGSDLDRELKAELKGTSDKSRTDMKKDSDHRQAVGEALMDLRPKLLKGLDLPERLMQSLAEAKKLTDFGAKRRQLQHVGKMMRQLDEATVMACEAALQAQHQGGIEVVSLSIPRQAQPRQYVGFRCRGQLAFRSGHVEADFRERIQR